MMAMGDRRNPPPALLDFVCWQGVGARGSDRKGLLGAEHRLAHSDGTAPRRPRHDHHPRAGRPQGPRAVRRPAGLRPAGRRDGQRIDTVERDLFRQLLGLGHTLLSRLRRPARATATSGRRPRPPEGRTVRRLPERHDRRYVSIFGELTITRVVYGTREGQKIERVPLDERLGLPEGDFSYVLEDWGQRLCLKGSFAEAGQSLEMLLGLRLGTRALEQMNRAVAGVCPGVPGRPWRRPRREEEGPLLVVTADGKGVPMRRPPQERPRSPTTAGPRGRRRTRSRWPASGRSTASSRSCGRPRTSSTRCCGTRRPRSGPGRSTSTSGPR